MVTFLPTEEKSFYSFVPKHFWWSYIFHISTLYVNIVDTLEATHGSIGNFIESTATKLQSILCKHCTVHWGQPHNNIMGEWRVATKWANFESELQFHSSEQIKMAKCGATMTTRQTWRSTMSSPRTGILSLIRFDLGQTGMCKTNKPKFLAGWIKGIILDTQLLSF